MVSMLRNSEIINMNRFQKEVGPFISRAPRQVIIDVPMKEKRIEFTAQNFENVVKEVLKISTFMPNKKCALTYKINENSSITLEIHPVTDAA